MTEAFHGLIKSGPLKGRTHAQIGSRRYTPPGQAGGFYVYVPRKGPVAAEWKWVETKEKT